MNFKVIRITIRMININNSIQVKLNIKYIYILLVLLFFTSCTNTENSIESNTIYSILDHNSLNALNNEKITVQYAYNTPNIIPKEPSICWYKNDIKLKCGDKSYYILTEEDKNSKFTVVITPEPSSITLNKTKYNTIYIKQIIDSKEIIDNFNSYIDIYSEKMRYMLTKNNNNSKTTILYDVQVHLQNSIIYADERGDKEMLRSILGLIKIAFEKQYLTNGMWLDSVGNRAGKEVDLFIAQYFNLVTRTLSACERHSIDTNFSQYNIKIIYSHINKWIKKEVNRKRINDLNLYTVMSILQFNDYLKQKNYSNDNFSTWKRYVQNYINFSIEPKWDKRTCIHQNNKYSCWALDRTGLVNHYDFAYAGYGKELTKTFSNTDPKAMFDANGIVKHPKKLVKNVSMDLSHARRLNWFFEVIKRFGTPFNVSMEEEALQGWANNLAFKVSKGTIHNPYFTTFSDGIDGWYRVNYRKRKKFGYAPGEMNIHFVGSSYGFFGIYNAKIYDWMENWVKINNSSKFQNGYAGGFKLDYLLSLLIDIRKPLIGINQ